MAKETQNSEKQIAEIWALFKENGRQIAKMQAENNRRAKENDLRAKENDRQIAKMQAENNLRAKENDRQIAKMQAENNRRALETDLWIKENNRRIKDNDRQIQKIGGQFNKRWGHFVESLVQGNLVTLLRKWGIEVTDIHPNVVQTSKTDNGDRTTTREWDIIAANGKEVVVVEVKTVLTKTDIENFLQMIKQFKKFVPLYKSMDLYGAMAYLKQEGKAYNLAEDKGLFVIRATGDSANIINKKDFKPKLFH